MSHAIKYRIPNKKGRLIPVSIMKYVHSSIGNLVGELAVSGNYKFETTADKFARLSDLEFEVSRI